MVTLYYLPGSCALAAHIALEAAQCPYKAVRLERGEQNEEAYLAVNPLGRVPALLGSDGHAVTEVPAILSWIADTYPNAHLLPPLTDPDRYQTLSWMAYLASTVHPAFARLWRAERIASDADAIASVEQVAKEALQESFEYLDTAIRDRRLIQNGESISVLECYLFVFCRWGLRLPAPTGQYTELNALMYRLSEHPAVMAAMKDQQIQLQGPQSGPG